MNSWDNSLRSLTMPMARGQTAQLGVRAELEERLTPLIRCVLRTGAGVPALVQWVRRVLRQLPAADAEQNAPRMARLLSAELIRQGKPDAFVGRRAGAETVVGS